MERGAAPCMGENGKKGNKKLQISENKKEE